MIPSDGLRALLIAEAELGERIMRALILRRVSLIDSDAGGVVLIGADNSPDVVRLQNFLSRNGLPHHLLDPETDPEAKELIARYAPSPSELPLVVALDGTVLRNPGEHPLGRALGMVTLPSSRRSMTSPWSAPDRPVLSTAVYAASEGLSVTVLDALGVRRTGRRQRADRELSRLPDRDFRQALAGRAYVQAHEIRRRDDDPGRGEIARLHAQGRQFRHRDR